MKDKEFNLLHEPWIMAMKPDGSFEELSILDVFRRAPEFKGLAGELPTQDVAVLRLLLAILHSVFGRYDTEGEYAPICSDTEMPPAPFEVLERWKKLWDMKAFPMSVIESYLKAYEDRFYLFHPERPFYQVAALKYRDDKFGPFESSKLNGELSESNNKPRLFPQRTGEYKNTLSYAEAARWLLHINSFSETFGKLEAKGKKSGDTQTLGVGWLGKLGLINAFGGNLFETLMLNLVFLKDGENVLWSSEKPIWESEFVKEAERTMIPAPDNLSELYTLQSRRLLLERKDDIVTGYSFLSGDYFPKENAFCEQMTVWKRNDKNKSEIPEYYPKKHKYTRQMWRDFSSLVILNNEYHRPGIVSWLSRLISEKKLSRLFFKFQTTAISYGTMEAVVDDLFSDSLSFNAGLLTELGADWISRIIAEIETTELLVKQVGYLAQNINKAAGHSDGGKQKESAMEQAYFRLDIPFRSWLESIDPEKSELSRVCDTWWEQEQRIIRNLGKELVEESGLRAFTGREIKEKLKGKDVVNFYSSPKAFNAFMARTANRQTLKGGHSNE